MTARISAEQERQLGLTRPKRSRKHAPRNGAVTRCCACGESFTTDAAETRHVSLTHSRFELVAS